MINKQLMKTIILRKNKSFGMKIFFFSLALAVFSVTFILNMTMGIRGQLQSDASQLLGADLLIESTTPISEEAMNIVKQRGVKYSTQIDFLSMASAGTSMELCAITALTGDYPLRGTLVIDTQQGKQNTNVAPPSGEAWAEESLYIRLHKQINDHIDIGDQSLTLTGVIRERPVVTSDVSLFAPIVYVNAADLEKMGVLHPGSRVTYRLLLTGKADLLLKIRAQLEPILESHVKWITPESGRSSISNVGNKVERYLSLGLLIQIILASIAIGITSHQQGVGLQREMALWRCLGATHHQFLRHVTLGMFIVSFLVMIIGIAFAYGASYIIFLLAKQWFHSAFSLPYLSGLMGLILGTILCIGFGYPPISALKNISPKIILQKYENEPYRVNRVKYGLTVLFIMLLFGMMVQEPYLILKFILGLTALSVIVYFIISKIWTIFSYFKKSSNTIWRLGSSYLVRYKTSAVFQCAIFSVVIALLLLIHIMQNNFIDRWRAELPQSSPNYFLINIQPDHVGSLQKDLENITTSAIQFYPIVRGRLTHINQNKVDEPNLADQTRGLYRPINLTWMKQLPIDNRVLSGVNWSDVRPKSLEISVEKEFAQRQGVTLGDYFTFDIGGDTLSAKIVQLRSVEWGSLRPNFFVIFPDGVLEKYAHSYMLSAYVSKNERDKLFSLIKQYPDLSIVDIDALIEKMRFLIHHLSTALSILLSFIGVFGLLILLATLISTLKERIYESALLRILGASNTLIRKIFSLEFILLGAMSGLLGSASALILAYFVAQYYFSMTFTFPLKWVVLSIIGAILLIFIFGTLGVRTVYRSSPLVLFRKMS